MTYIDELKELIRLHVRTQSGVRTLEAVLRRIDDEHREGAGGWIYEWMRAGDTYAAAGLHGIATQCYNFARFPFVDGVPRRRAHEHCLAAFDTHVRSTSRKVVRAVVPCEGGDAVVYTSGSYREGLPVLMVIGGIVSLKEQWESLLTLGKRLGFFVILTEFPGVGENTLRYGPGVERYLGEVLDHVTRGAPRVRAYLLAISFSGNLALKYAPCDPRIAGVVTSGAPIRRFFVDARWLERVPETTRRTLAHVCGIPISQLSATLRELAVDDATLRKLSIPVRYIAATRDEIVPYEEAALIAKLPDAQVLSLDDVHGAPHQLAVVRAYILWALLDVRRSSSPVKWLLRAILFVQQRRRTLSDSRAAAGGATELARTAVLTATVEGQP